MNATPAILAVALVAFAVVSKRLSRSAVSGTMLFTALGLAVGPEAFDLVDFSGPLGRSDFVNLLLTATLVIVLFTVALSVVLQGLSAWWGSNAYADYVEGHPGHADLVEARQPASAVRVPLRARHQAMQEQPQLR